MTEKQIHTPAEHLAAIQDNASTAVVLFCTDHRPIESQRLIDRVKSDEGFANDLMHAALAEFLMMGISVDAPEDMVTEFVRDYTPTITFEHMVQSFRVFARAKLRPTVKLSLIGEGYSVAKFDDRMSAFDDAVDLAVYKAQHDHALDVMFLVREQAGH